MQHVFQRLVQVFLASSIITFLVVYFYNVISTRSSQFNNQRDSKRNRQIKIFFALTARTLSGSKIKHISQLSTIAKDHYGIYCIKFKTKEETKLINKVQYLNTYKNMLSLAQWRFALDLGILFPAFMLINHQLTV